MVKIGFEQEFSFRNGQQEYLDLANADYHLFNSVVEKFPVFAGDELIFDCKSLEKYPKRCYVEGVERYAADGVLIATDPKGLELRTTPHTSMNDLIAEFRHSFQTMVRIAQEHDLYPLLASRHPFKTRPTLGTPISEKERSLRTDSELQIALNSTLSHGFHINVSRKGFSWQQTEALAEKINYYAPYIIPYSFSSPFYDGQLSEHLSTRTYLRAGTRQLVDMSERNGESIIQFRGYDPVGDVKTLRAILFLTKGLVLDTSLKGKSAKQDAKMLMQSCSKGFSTDVIKTGGLEVLVAVKKALGDEGSEILILENLLQTNESESTRIRKKYARCGNIIESVSDRYKF